MTREYLYYAFISYKSENADWALRLKKKLQNYRLPTRTHRQHVDLPYRCSPVFLDKTNLTPGSLNKGLREEVQSARYLVVICSHYAHDTPKYLDEELQYFLDGGGDPANVIPFVVDACDDPLECYPSRLAALSEERELMPIMACEMSRQEALLSLISRMHQIKQEELARDETRRRRVHRAILALLVLALLCGCGWLWDYNRLKTAYYLDYTEAYGVPVGIGKLSKAEISSMSRHYRIVRSRGRVRELAYENAYGTLMAHSGFQNRDRPSRMTYEYRKNGLLSRVTCYDQYNDISLMMAYTEINSTAALVDLQQEGAYGRSAAMDVTLLSSDGNFFENRNTDGGGDKIARYWLQFDRNGYVAYQVYIENPSTNAVAADADGISQLHYTRDELGRPRRMELNRYTGSSWIFNEEGYFSDFADSQGTTGGVKYIDYQYNDAGDLAEIRFLGQHDIPVTGFSGISVARSKYDEHHRLLAGLYLGTDGSPILCDEGYAFIAYEYDAHGNNTKIRCFGTDIEPVMIAMGFSGKDMTYDAHGRVRTEKALGLNGEPVMLPEGYCILQTDYDSNGRPLSFSVFDTDGKAVAPPFGYASVRYLYDPKGEISEERYYGIDGKPVCNTSGIAAILYEYNDQGLETKESYLDAQGLPAPLSGQYASVAFRYDDRGNQTDKIFYGTDGEPYIVPVYGYAWLHREYDKENNLTLELYLGPDGEPVISPYYGDAGARWVYDTQQYRRQEIFLGPDGEPMTKAGGYALVETGYNTENTLSYASFRDEKGELILTKLNFAGIQYRRDARDCRMPLYCDTDANAISCEGCAAYEVSVDASNSVPLRWVWLDEDGKPTQRNGSCGYIAEYRKDLYNPFRVETFRGNEVPALSEAHERRRYDGRGNLLRVGYYGTDDRPTLTQDSWGSYSSVSYAYDERNKLTQMRFFDADGQPILCSEGYARLQITWDEDGNLLSRSYFGVHDEAVCSTEGFASYNNQFDAHGHVIRSDYYGADGKPILFYDGKGFYASIENEYNEEGEMIRTRFFGTDGKPILYEGCYAEQESVTEYSDRGYSVTIRYLGLNGEPVLGPDGFSYVVNRYDERGNWVEYRHFDTEGKPSTGSTGAGMRYDNNGNLIDEWQLDP